MSPITATPPRVRRLDVTPFERRALVEPQPRRDFREPVAIFFISAIFFSVVGLWTTIGLSLVKGDAQSRLFHAYHVWANEPGKLTAIGFYWPPVQTLVLLPYAAVRELATSLAALPLMSATFAGLLLVVLNGALESAGVTRPLRWLLLVAFGLNPMIFAYATNGMGEIVYLSFLTFALYVFLRWVERPRWQLLAVLGIAFALGVLARYEVGFWFPIVAVGVVVVLLQRRADGDRIEASLLALTAPLVYALTLWTFVAWTILDDPLGWLTILIPKTRGEVEQEGLVGIGEAVRSIASEQFGLFPLAFLLIPVVLVVAARRKSVAGYVLAGALLVNFASSFAILARSGNAVYLELRYNMRALPIAVLAIAWLLSTVPKRRRQVAALVAVAAVALTIPVTAVTMLDNPRGDDGEWVRSVIDRTPSAHLAAAIDDEHDMATRIVALGPQQSAVLTDDALTFGVLLFDGDPNRYFDRIDLGDKEWTKVRDAIFASGGPIGGVRYLLITRSPGLIDELVEPYPFLRTGPLPPFLHLLYRNNSYVLYELRRRTSETG